MTLANFVAVDQRDPWWLYPAVLGSIAFVVLVLWLLNKIIIHYFPSTKDYHVSLGNALMRVEAGFLPGREHVVEASERDDAEEDDQGEPPETGSHHNRT